ncbi:hypothetical protein EDD11_001801 [Mortierella claussenii]|nr:hypothetical protein EDD11_001801 [Mortierella claussenii]
MPPKKKTSTRKTRAVLAAEAAAAATEAAALETSDVALAEADANVQGQKLGVKVMDAEEKKEETAAVVETIKLKKTTRTKRVTTVTTTTTTSTSAPEEPQEMKEVDEAKEINEEEMAKIAEERSDVEMAAQETAPEPSPKQHQPQGQGQGQDQDLQTEKTQASLSDAKNATPLTMIERMEKLKGLRQKMNVSKQANRADLMAEHQKSKVNKREESKKERAREEAEKLIAKRDAEEAGEDYERSQFWNYSAESVEKWNDKQEAKRLRMDNKFTDWDQVNHKKYLKQVAELKPNLAAYNAKKDAAMHTNDEGELVVASDSGFYRDANSVAFLSDAKPDALAVDRLAADVAKQIDARTRFSKRRAHKEDEDVNYINDANQRFNQKISRFYDKYTKEIRDDFERGTALTLKKLFRSDAQHRAFTFVMDEVKVKKEPGNDHLSLKRGIGAEHTIYRKRRKLIVEEEEDEDDEDDEDNSAGVELTQDKENNAEDTDEDGEDEEDDEEDVFEVEKVVGHKMFPWEGLKYHIKWKGYKESDNSYEPEASVFCHGLVKEYWDRHIARGGARDDTEGHDPAEQTDTKRQSRILPDLDTFMTERSPPPARRLLTSKSKTKKKATSRDISGIGSDLELSTKRTNRGRESKKADTPPKWQKTKTLSDGDARTTSKPQQRRRSRTGSVHDEAHAPETISRDREGPTSDVFELREKDQRAPPLSWNSWEDHIQAIHSVERKLADGQDGPLVVHIIWKSGGWSEVLATEAHRKCPQTLLEYYESHLQFMESISVE